MKSILRLLGLTCLLAAPLLSAGCFHAGIRPRTADVLSAGEVAGGVNFTVVTIETGEVELDDGDTVEGFSGWRGLLHPLIAIYSEVLDSQGYLRVGFADGAEVGLLLGPQELGAEVRAAILDEDHADSVSMAASAAATWRPFMDSEQPYFRAGVDLSSRFEQVVPVGGLYASFGPETHAVSVPNRLYPDCQGFGQPGCGEYGPRGHFLYTRNEFRLQGTLGMSFRFTDKSYYTAERIKLSGHRLTFGIVPYATLWSEPSKYECVECTFGAGRFESDWGMSITVAYDYFPDDGYVSP